MGNDFRTISICCLKCGSLLYKYCKYGTGSLVKCFLDGITEDQTQGDMKCPSCGVEFARFKMIGGKPAHRIIRGKVLVKGMRRK